MAGSKPCPLSRISTTTCVLAEPRPERARRSPRRASTTFASASRPMANSWVSTWAGQRQPRLGSTDLDGQALRSAQLDGVPRQLRNQPVVDRFAAQLVDQRANLALHAPGQVRDRVECSADRARRGCRPPGPRPSARCAHATQWRTGPETPNHGGLALSGAVPPRPARPPSCVLGRAPWRIARAR